MNRRELLQRVTLTLGYAISAPMASAVLSGCKPKAELTYKPVFFNEDQARLVAAIADTILPRTDTPGAIDANVPAFIDDMVATVYDAARQKSFLDGLASFASEAKESIGDDFTEATAEQQLAFVKTKNEEAVAAGNVGGSEGWWAAAGAKSARPFILDIKELTIIGFFTSEAGATKVLQYNQSPGPYRGCVPLAEVGKTWAT